MNKQVKLQVPIDRETLNKLKRRAADLGFDSAQAYIRVWAKAKADGRELDFGEDKWGEPSDKAAERLHRRAKEAKRDSNAGKLNSYSTVEEFMKDLRSEENTKK